MRCVGEWGGYYYLTNGNGGIVYTSESQPAQFDLNGNYLGGSIIRYSVIEYSFGGIGTGPAAPFIDHNLIRNNRDAAISCGMCSSQLVISNNRIINNDAAYVLNLVGGQAKIYQNLIANNMGCVRILSGQEIILNTITANKGCWCHSAQGAVCLEGPAPPFPIIQGNNLYANKSPYEVVMGTFAGRIGDVNAPGNYWGTTDTAAIQSRIYDINQNINAGIFTFVPFINQPNPTAPPILYHLSLNPISPIGIHSVTFDLIFSRPMDQSFNPTVTFGATAPFTQYSILDNAQWVNNTTWRATFEVTPLVPRGVHTISVGGAKDIEGDDIPIDTRFNFTVAYSSNVYLPVISKGFYRVCPGGPGTPPTLNWVTISPNSVPSNSNTQVFVQFSFSDPNGDLDNGTFNYLSPAGQTVSLPLPNELAGISSYTVSAMVIIATDSQKGAFKIPTWLKDKNGNCSNIVYVNWTQY